MVLYPQYRLELYRKTGDGVWSNTPVIINDIVDIDNRWGVETTKDTVSFRVNNIRRTSGDIGSWSYSLGRRDSYLNNIFRVDDEFMLYAYYGSALPTNREDALLLAGAIGGFDFNNSGQLAVITTKGVNRTEELLNAMVPFSTRVDTGVTNTAPTAIIQMIARLNTWNPRKRIIALLSTQQSAITGSYGNVQATMSDHTVPYTNGLGSWGNNGTAFPVIDYNETWRPTYYNIEKLSSPEYTYDESGNYVFHVKYTKVLPPFQSQYGQVINELVWKSKNLVSYGSITEGTDIINVNVGFSVRDIQNLLIVNAGTDLNGVGIVGVSYNAESIGKYGAKMGYYSKSRRMFSKISNYEKNLLTSAGSTFDDDGYPSGYPITMSFKSRDAFGSPTGAFLTASGKTAFNQNLRDEARWLAQIEGNGILKRLGEPRYTVSADLPVGSNTYIPGQIYDFVIPSYGWFGTATNPAYKLRLRDMIHNIGPQGWTTRIEAEEDEDVISRLLGNRT